MNDQENSPFRTSADTRFNSFVDPLNPVNTTPGNWGINAAYLTPSYMAPFRPRYEGEYGQQSQSGNPKWSQSINTLVNPFANQGNYGGNTYQQYHPYASSFVASPIDLFVHGVQKYALPGASMYYTLKGFFGGKGTVLDAASTGIGRGIGSGVARGLASMGAATGLGSGVAAEVASIGAVGGAVGGAIGGMFLPTMALQAALKGADSLFFDPYTIQRQSSENIRRNFSGMTFGEKGYGNKVTGGGLSRESSSKIAKLVGQLGAKDLTFDQKEIASIMDMSSRAGLFDSTQASQIGPKLKNIVSQVKLVMQLANTSDLKDTIEIISKMQSMGAVGAAASMSLSKVNAYASIAGTTTQSIMNTVGAQGRFMYQANNLTPYLGQEAAAQSHASFSAAFRSGAMSPSLMARMGGVQGATQSSLEGQVAMYKTPYAQMIAMNSILGGGAGGTIASNMSGAGGLIAKSPLSMIGNMGLFEGAMSSYAAKDPKFLNEMLKQVGAPYSKGKMTPGAAYSILTQRMNLSPESARAYIHEQVSNQDPAHRAQQLAGINKSEVDATLKFREQQGMDYGSFGHEVQALKHVGRSMKDWGTEVMADAFIRPMSKAQDWVEDKFLGYKFQRESDSELKDPVNQLKYKDPRLENNRFVNSPASRADSHIYDINALARAGDKNAKAFTTSFTTGVNETPEQKDQRLLSRSQAITGMRKSGGLNIDAKDSRFLLNLSGSEVEVEEPIARDSTGKVSDQLNTYMSPNHTYWSDTLGKVADYIPKANPQGMAAKLLLGLGSAALKKVSRRGDKETDPITKLFAHSAFSAVRLAKAESRDEKPALRELMRMYPQLKNEAEANLFFEEHSETENQAALASGLTGKDISKQLGMSYDDWKKTSSSEKNFVAALGNDTEAITKYKGLDKTNPKDKELASAQILAKHKDSNFKGFIGKPLKGADTRYSSDEDINNFELQMKSLEEARQRVHYLFKNNAITKDKEYDTLNAIDNRQSVAVFERAVDKFAVTVGSEPGKAKKVVKAAEDASKQRTTSDKPLFNWPWQGF